MRGTYDPLLGTQVMQGALVQRSVLHRLSLIWRGIEPFVFLGAAVGLGWAAWKYYDRKAAMRTYGRHMTGKTVGLVVGRDDEIDRVISILCRKTKNCAALVGHAGVGKTAIAEGLAQRIATGKVPAALAGARVVEIDLGAMVAGTPALARGRIRCVGATTFDGYRNYIEKDPALERRFQKVHIEEPSTQATIGILRGLKQQFEQHHGLEIQDAALVAAAQLAARYITGRQFPDKAIDLIDEACTATIKRAISANPTKGAAVVSQWTGIPVCTLEQEEKDKLIHLADRLHERVVGQDEAVNLVAETVLCSMAGLDHPGQPIGSFLFLGSTGVGKTELAKALAEQLFGSEKMLVRFDMSEYVGSGSILRLIGAPPSHDGYDDGGQLTEKVRNRPYSVILFDEVEKADPSVLNIFIQLLDDGVLTDGKGRTVDFKNTIIIMTSNLGAEHLTAGMAGEITMDAARDLLMKQVQKHFKPEFLNRLSEIVVFEPLLHDKLKEIVKIQMKSVIARVADKGISLFASDAALDVILSDSYNPMYGARPIRRWLEKNVMTKLSQMLVKGEASEGSTITIGATDNRSKLKYEVAKKAE
uniref:ATP-dependent Clp protease ATP-binding subunit clpC n=1 Tax=Aegilops tauschii subsp. strangulata TaxID=200361 RepID=A0A453LZF8_AEGTS